MRRFVACVAMVGSACSITRPAENGPQDMVLFGSPTYENITGRPTDPVQLEMMASILGGEQVGFVVNDPAERDAYADQLVADYGVDQSTVDDDLIALPIEHTDIWFRDMGGVFVHGSAGGLRSKAVVDFEFDGWGYGAFSSPDIQDLYAIDNLVSAELGDALGLPVIWSPLIMEGGAFQSNGEGVIAYSLQAALQRNPTWSQYAIELELKRVLGAKKLLAIPTFHPFDGHAVLDGPLELDGEYYHLPITVRHADEVMQFVDATTILVAQIDASDVTNDLEQLAKDRLDEIWTYLAGQTDQDGNPFTLVPFPDPGFIPETMVEGDPLWDYVASLDGIQHADPAGGNIVIPASYMNYVVTNDTVLVAKFYKDGRNPRLIDADAEAISVLESLYPTRTVLAVDAENVNVGGGGMHCITQEIRSL